jgi:hypothetical protein
MVLDTGTFSALDSPEILERLNSRRVGLAEFAASRSFVFFDTPIPISRQWCWKFSIECLLWRYVYAHSQFCPFLSPTIFLTVPGGRILILWSFIVVIGLISIRLSIYQLVCATRYIYVFKSLFSTVMVPLSIGCADELCFTSTLVHNFDVIWFMFIAVCGVGQNLLLYL